MLGLTIYSFYHAATNLFIKCVVNGKTKVVVIFDIIEIAMSFFIFLWSILGLTSYYIGEKKSNGDLPDGVLCLFQKD